MAGPPRFSTEGIMDKTSIINLALSHHGASPISDINEGSTEANAALVNYDAARRSVLRDFHWSFALRLKTLARLPDQEPGEYNYVYALPVDCLYPLRLREAHEATDFDDRNVEAFAVRGKFFYCNHENPRLEYIADVEDTSFFDPLFVEAFSYRLAAKLAMPITGTDARCQYLMQWSASLLERAAASSAREQRDHGSANAYVDARN